MQFDIFQAYAYADVMKRSKVIKTLKKEANERGLSFEVKERTRHSAITIDGFTSFLGRHNEIDDVTAHRFFDQYAPVLGKGWWRK